MNKKLLLYTCCASCALPILDYLENQNFDITLYFSNSNILNKEEFDRRLSDVVKIAKLYNCEVAVDKYCHQEWLDCLSKNLKKDLKEYQENSERCFECLSFRTQRLKEYFLENNFDMVSSTFLTSMHKDAKKVESWLKEFGVEVLLFDVDKKDFYQKGIELSKKYDVYRQKFCGCEFGVQKSGCKEL